MTGLLEFSSRSRLRVRRDALCTPGRQPLLDTQHASPTQFPNLLRRRHCYTNHLGSKWAREAKIVTRLACKRLSSPCPFRWARQMGSHGSLPSGSFSCWALHCQLQGGWEIKFIVQSEVFLRVRLALLIITPGQHV